MTIIERSAKVALISKAKANYRPRTDDNVNCTNCRHVEEHGESASTCQIVAGTVDHAHVCDYFDRKSGPSTIRSAFTPWPTGTWPIAGASVSHVDGRKGTCMAIDATGAARVDFGGKVEIVPADQLKVTTPIQAGVFDPATVETHHGPPDKPGVQISGLRNWKEWDEEHPWEKVGHHAKSAKEQAAAHHWGESGAAKLMGIVKGNKGKKKGSKPESKPEIKPTAHLAPKSFPPSSKNAPQLHHAQPQAKKVYTPEETAAYEAKQAQKKADAAKAAEEQKAKDAAYFASREGLTGGYAHRDLHGPEGDGPWGPQTKNSRYGAVMFDGKGHVLLREPLNHFDGYHWTFPKGHLDNEEHPSMTAMRETEEETGLTPKFVGHVPGGFTAPHSATTGSVNHYYLAEDSGREFNPDMMNGETQKLVWATPQQADDMMAEGTNKGGVHRDRTTLRAAVKAYEAARPDVTKSVPLKDLEPLPSPPPKPAAKSSEWDGEPKFAGEDNYHGVWQPGMKLPGDKRTAVTIVPSMWELDTRDWKHWHEEHPYLAIGHAHGAESEAKKAATAKWGHDWGEAGAAAEHAKHHASEVAKKGTPKPRPPATQTEKDKAERAALNDRFKTEAKSIHNYKAGSTRANNFEEGYASARMNAHDFDMEKEPAHHLAQAHDEISHGMQANQARAKREGIAAGFHAHSIGHGETNSESETPTPKVEASTVAAPPKKPILFAKPGSQYAEDSPEKDAFNAGHQSGLSMGQDLELSPSEAFSAGQGYTNATQSLPPGIEKAHKEGYSAGLFDHGNNKAWHQSHGTEDEVGDPTDEHEHGNGADHGLKDGQKLLGQGQSPADVHAYATKFAKQTDAPYDKGYAEGMHAAAATKEPIKLPGYKPYEPKAPAASTKSAADVVNAKVAAKSIHQKVGATTPGGNLVTKNEMAAHSKFKRVVGLSGNGGNSEHVVDKDLPVSVLDDLHTSALAKATKPTLESSVLEAPKPVVPPIGHLGDATPKTENDLKQMKHLSPGQTFSNGEKVPNTGSNGGDWYEDNNGQGYLVKGSQSNEHAMNDVAGALAYQQAGVSAQKVSLLKMNNGQLRPVSHYISGLKPVLSPKDTDDTSRASAREGSGMDALMSHYDLTGMVMGNGNVDGPNLFKDKEGKVVRLDLGGTGRFRAQGGTKPTWKVGGWDSQPTSENDYNTIRKFDQGKLAYGVTKPEEMPEDMKASLAHAANFDTDKYHQSMLDAGLSKQFADDQVAVIKSRQEHLKSKGLGSLTEAPKVEAPKVVTGSVNAEPSIEDSYKSGIKSSSGMSMKHLQFNDGTEALTKPFNFSGMGASGDTLTAEQRLDHAVLATKVARAVGADVPDDFAPDKNTLVMRIAKGTEGSEVHDLKPFPGEDYGGPGTGDGLPPDRLVKSESGKKLGLADLLMGNHDRNTSNWFEGPGNHVSGIDHDEAAFPKTNEPGHHGSPFADQLVSEDKTAYAPNDFSAAELSKARTNLEALKPQFDAKGMSSEHQSMLQRLSHIEAASKDADKIPTAVGYVPKPKVEKPDVSDFTPTDLNGPNAYESGHMLGVQTGEKMLAGGHTPATVHMEADKLGQSTNIHGNGFTDGLHAAAAKHEAANLPQPKAEPNFVEAKDLKFGDKFKSNETGPVKTVNAVTPGGNFVSVSHTDEHGQTVLTNMHKEYMVEKVEGSAGPRIQSGTHDVGEKLDTKYLPGSPKHTSFAEGHNASLAHAQHEGFTPEEALKASEDAKSGAATMNPGIQKAYSEGTASGYAQHAIQQAQPPKFKSVEDEGLATYVSKGGGDFKEESAHPLAHAKMENHVGTSNKFYESKVTQQGDKFMHETAYGSLKPGAHVTTSATAYDTPEMAQIAHNKLVNSKLAKGYTHMPVPSSPAVHKAMTEKKGAAGLSDAMTVAQLQPGDTTPSGHQITKLSATQSGPTGHSLVSVKGPSGLETNHTMDDKASVNSLIEHHDTKVANVAQAMTASHDVPGKETPKSTNIYAGWAEPGDKFEGGYKVLDAGPNHATDEMKLHIQGPDGKESTQTVPTALNMANVIAKHEAEVNAPRVATSTHIPQGAPAGTTWTEMGTPDGQEGLKWTKNADGSLDAHIMATGKQFAHHTDPEKVHTVESKLDTGGWEKAGPGEAWTTNAHQFAKNGTTWTEKGSKTLKLKWTKNADASLSAHHTETGEEITHISSNEPEKIASTEKNLNEAWEKHAPGSVAAPTTLSEPKEAKPVKVPDAFTGTDAEAYLSSHSMAKNLGMEMAQQGKSPDQVKDKGAPYYAQNKKAKLAGDITGQASAMGMAHGYLAASKEHAANLKAGVNPAETPEPGSTSTVMAKNLKNGDQILVNGGVKQTVSQDYDSGDGMVMTVAPEHVQGGDYDEIAPYMHEANPDTTFTKLNPTHPLYNAPDDMTEEGAAQLAKGDAVSQTPAAPAFTKSHTSVMTKNLKKGDQILVNGKHLTITMKGNTLHKWTDDNGDTGSIPANTVKVTKLAPSHPQFKSELAADKAEGLAAHVVGSGDSQGVQTSAFTPGASVHMAKAQPVKFTSDLESNGEPFHQHPGYNNDVYDKAYAESKVTDNPSHDLLSAADKAAQNAKAGTHEAAQAKGHFNGLQAAELAWAQSHKSEAKKQQEKEFVDKVNGSYTSKAEFRVDGKSVAPVTSEIPHGIKPSHGTAASSVGYDQAIAQGYDQAVAAHLQGKSPEQIMGSAKEYLSKADSMGELSDEADILEQAHIAGLAQGAGKAAVDLKADPNSHSHASSKSIISQGVLADKSGKGAYKSAQSGNPYMNNQSSTQLSFTPAELHAVGVWKSNYRYSKGAGFVKALDTLGAGKDPGNSEAAKNAKKIYEMYVDKAEPNTQAMQRKVSGVPAATMTAWTTVGKEINIPLTSWSTDPNAWHGNTWLHAPPGTVSLDIGRVVNYGSEVETIGGGNFIVKNVKKEGKITHIYLEQTKAVAS